MERRDFLARTAAIVSAGFGSGSFRSDGYRFTNSALAANEGGVDKASLEQKFAEFALSIKYEALPADVIVSAKRVLLDTLGCAFGSVGSEPANIAETTIRKTFGDGNAATVIGYPRSATVEGALFVNGVLRHGLLSRVDDKVQRGAKLAADIFIGLMLLTFSIAFFGYL